MPFPTKIYIKLLLNAEVPTVPAELRENVPRLAVSPAEVNVPVGDVPNPEKALIKVVEEVAPVIRASLIVKIPNPTIPGPANEVLVEF